ncbi:hypothetical protein [Goodfellowiella coeruleoviolacea]|uniref:Uncharacterized protein n=1 Tax=Goodfellowiella coeruleoviolacea TaxID=334858 RepID=A0AAE3KI59_9PSEU|nr:hypothetical protein [Goodfellowiella coeruleoviolacea]MCP2168140.1 hypothetical protein [Goodfellowiella coeruleoviolacea]
MSDFLADLSILDVGLALGALAAVWAVVVRVARVGRKLSHVADDWLGEPERDGVPARPGVMERLAAIEQRVTVIEHEVRPNSGASLRDAVDRVERRIVGGDQ